VLIKLIIWSDLNPAAVSDRIEDTVDCFEANLSSNTVRQKSQKIQTGGGGGVNCAIRSGGALFSHRVRPPRLVAP